jgi:hypothetical protein
MNSSLSVLPRPLLALSGLVLDPPQALIRGGYTPDEWQRRVVCELGRPRRPGQPVRRVVVVTARQVGKTIAAAAAVASRLVLDSGVLVVVVSASEKQASEVARHVRRLLAVLLVDVDDLVAESASGVELGNGSRLVVVAASSSAVRGWSAGMLVIDEAAFVTDETIDAVLPTLVASGGDLALMSTPAAPVGRFYDLWCEAQTSPGWLALQVTAAECARIPPTEVAAMRRRLAPSRAERDLDAQFTEPSGSVVSAAALAAAFDAGTESESGWLW